MRIRNLIQEIEQVDPAAAQELRGMQLGTEPSERLKKRVAQATRKSGPFANGRGRVKEKHTER